MFRHIVAAVDDHQGNVQALRQAGRLAAAVDARLTLCHVVDLQALANRTVGTSDNHQLHEAGRQAAQALLEAAEKVALNEGCHRIHLHAGETWEGKGALAHAFVQFAERERADLVVLGTHGRTGLRHLLMGSFAEAVLREAPCPVMVIRGDQEEADSAMADRPPLL
ncbi:universal stress protein [Gulbenkiania mobilis]|uniref:Universal stress protein n=1 Tax=Gulbenkiania mobilis TaxID=397457 RepID=A0ABY2CYP1_GULMO|nr:nucleotide-binding universal stress UspA family protein [Gulbenkiania mobilis]